MSARSVITRLTPLAAIVAASWAFTPGEDAGASTWVPPGHGSAVFLQQSGSAGWSSVTGGTSRNHLPSSVIPSPVLNPVCSVDTTDAGTPPVCSTGPNALLCSAICDAAQQCSAFFVPVAAGGSAACSTLGGPGQQRCSVLQAPFGAVLGPSQCSASGGGLNADMLCSVLAGGFRKACSAESPALSPDNFCSTLRSPLPVGRLQCSVINSNPNRKNFCSTANPPSPIGFSKTCSTQSQDSVCSITLGQGGACTSFNGALPGTCSTQVLPSQCSVIGGPSGTFCSQP